MLKPFRKMLNGDETCSLLVIGTGFAGLGAALESHYLGMKDILVVDKMPSAGGNSIINGGAIAAAGTDMQEKANIKDNADLPLFRHSESRRRYRPCQPSQKNCRRIRVQLQVASRRNRC